MYAVIFLSLLYFIYYSFVSLAVIQWSILKKQNARNGKKTHTSSFTQVLSLRAHFTLHFTLGTCSLEYYLFMLPYTSALAAKESSQLDSQLHSYTAKLPLAINHHHWPTGDFAHKWCIYCPIWPQNQQFFNLKVFLHKPCKEFFVCFFLFFLQPLYFTTCQIIWQLLSQVTEQRVMFDTN